MITNTLTQETFNECLCLAKAKIPLSSWKVQPKGIGFTTHKVKYGLATSKGEVLLNPAFIGTEAYTKLKETIFHEFAHLIVGLEENHSSAFKRVLAYISDYLVVPADEYEMVKDNNGYKYRLLGFTQDNSYNLGGCFKRTKKYLNYDPKGRRTMSINGDKFLRFEYVSYDLKMPENTISAL